MEHLALAASLIFVLVVELLNSAVEAAIDRISPDHHELSGRAKDFGSAAVLLSLLLAVATWTTVLFPLLTGCSS
jgi:diacylglycerol kinase (ATP)